LLTERLQSFAAENNIPGGYTVKVVSLKS